MKKINILGLLVLAVLFSACSDWLDVSPKTEVKSKELFTTEDGFKSALTGIYGRMTNATLYGRDLSFLFLEQLAQRYDNVRYVTDEDRAEIYDYKNFTSSKNTIAAIWSGMYRNIANINNLLLNLEVNGHHITTSGYFELIKGEALSLRAFHYFDLLRMWGPVNYEENKSALVVPWRDQFTPERVPLMSADSLVSHILADLNEAEQLLANDPLIFTNNPEEPFISYRQQRMNRFAVKALKARVYLWTGDKEKAKICATDVIDNSGRKLVRDNQEDITLFDETLFGVNMFNMSENVNTYFSTRPGQNDEQLWVSVNDIREVFEGTGIGINDIRYKSGYGFLFSDQQVICRKYLESATPLYSEKIPLIRLAEMYYILTESVNIDDGARWINTVRNARGISRRYDVNFTTNAARIDELKKEYQKDFYAEGQFFYFLKRHNMKDFHRCPYENGMPESAYVFPIPDDEVEYGFVSQ